MSRLVSIALIIFCVGLVTRALIVDAQPTSGHSSSGENLPKYDSSSGLPPAATSGLETVPAGTGTFERKPITPSSAAKPRPERAPHHSMRENIDGVVKPGEYVVISPNGSITRSLCPYECSERNIPREHCRTWASIREPEKCYVQDTRIPSNAIPIGQ